MVARGLRVTAALLLCAATPMYVGCACKGTRTAFAAEKTTMKLAAERFDADVGECFAMVYMPPRFETVSEQVCIKEATQRLEVVPAEYAWVDEQVLVKDAYTELEILPGEFKTETRQVEIEPRTKGWTKHENITCDDETGAPLPANTDVYCLEERPAQFRTVSQQIVAKEPECREVHHPAEYQTVRRQKLVRPATTRTVTIPAEFETVTKRVQVAGGNMDWQQVVCEIHLGQEKVTQIENALASAGYDPGTPDGKLGETDWVALRSFQEDNGLGMGALTYQTLDKLGVKVD